MSQTWTAKESVKTRYDSITGVKYEDKNLWILDEQNNYIAIIARDESNKHAKLIAAAPELEKALNYILERENCDSFAEETMRVVRAALNKAKAEA